VRVIPVAALPAVAEAGAETANFATGPCVMLNVLLVAPISPVAAALNE
jgi:hypothetical protein